MISALADAGAVLERADYLDAARARDRFLLARHARRGRPPAAHLQPRRGPSSTPYLEDHAFLLEALLDLYEATFDARWFVAGAGARRRRSSSASPTPSAAASSPPPPTTSARRAPQGARGRARSRPARSSAALGLLRLAALTGEARYEERRARRRCALLHAIAPQHPTAFGHLLQAIDFHLAPVREVALVGPGRRPRSSASCARSFRPHLVLAGGEPGAVPLLEAARRSRAGRPPTSASASPAARR